MELPIRIGCQRPLKVRRIVGLLAEGHDGDRADRAGDALRKQENLRLIHRRQLVHVVDEDDDLDPAVFSANSQQAWTYSATLSCHRARNGDSASSYGSVPARSPLSPVCSMEILSANAFLMFLRVSRWGLEYRARSCVRIVVQTNRSISESSGGASRKSTWNHIALELSKGALTVRWYRLIGRLAGSDATE